MKISPRLRGRNRKSHLPCCQEHGQKSSLEVQLGRRLLSRCRHLRRKLGFSSLCSL